MGRRGKDLPPETVTKRGATRPMCQLDQLPHNGFIADIKVCVDVPIAELMPNLQDIQNDNPAAGSRQLR
jgi:hypothetical protein